MPDFPLLELELLPLRLEPLLELDEPVALDPLLELEALLELEPPGFVTPPAAPELPVPSFPPEPADPTVPVPAPPVESLCAHVMPAEATRSESHNVVW